VSVIVVERHPLLDADEHVASFAQSLPCRVRIRFHLCFDDGLLQALGQDKMVQTMRLLGVNEDECIENPMVSRGVRAAQRKVRNRSLAHATGAPVAVSSQEWLQQNAPELQLR